MLGSAKRNVFTKFLLMKKIKSHLPALVVGVVAILTAGALMEAGRNLPVVRNAKAGFTR